MQKPELLGYVFERTSSDESSVCTHVWWRGVLFFIERSDFDAGDIKQHLEAGDTPWAVAAAVLAGEDRPIDRIEIHHKFVVAFYKQYASIPCDIIVWVKT